MAGVQSNPNNPVVFFDITIGGQVSGDQARGLRQVERGPGPRLAAGGAGTRPEACGRWSGDQARGRGKRARDWADLL
ncbi:hypothetical protein chiPu_0033888 [Chiloscyllium punctatum]|uniref:Uncharacterized protein n=1 Tax=Chiloscyllium punctatum TaxID=137246 RepID=A0A401U4D5_CHIPU|nr:hypothetical protein [Chiloscyllium punctatum]